MVCRVEKSGMDRASKRGSESKTKRERIKPKQGICESSNVRIRLRTNRRYVELDADSTADLHRRGRAFVAYTSNGEQGE